MLIIQNYLLLLNFYDFLTIFIVLNHFLLLINTSYLVIYNFFTAHSYRNNLNFKVTIIEKLFDKKPNQEP